MGKKTVLKPKKRSEIGSVDLEAFEQMGERVSDLNILETLYGYVLEVDDAGNAGLLVYVPGCGSLQGVIDQYEADHEDDEEGEEEEYEDYDYYSPNDEKDNVPF